MKRLVRVWLFEWAALMALWFLLVARFELGETLVGALAAALGASGSAMVRKQRFVRFEPKLSWLVEVWRAPGYVLAGTSVIFWVLLHQLVWRKRPPSLLRSIRFDAGGNAGRSAARRALAVFFTALGPNFLAIGIDGKENSMLFHQIRSSGVPGVTRRLGAA